MRRSSSCSSGRGRRSPFNGMSKSTVAAETDPLGAMAFVQKHFSAARLGLVANACARARRATRARPPWSAVLGQCDLVKAGYPAGACELRTAVWASSTRRRCGRRGRPAARRPSRRRRLRVLARGPSARPRRAAPAVVRAHGPARGASRACRRIAGAVATGSAYAPTTAAVPRARARRRRRSRPAAHGDSACTCRPSRGTSRRAASRSRPSRGSSRPS